jgi:glycosyltransferase involved in cell wall biosynthesis
MTERCPLVSIIMPAYNTERFAKQAIESIAAQTYPNIELIIIEDCSPDNTAAVIEETLKTFTRPVRFIRRETNQLLARNYNDGVLMAKGEYITQVDTDDILPPNSIQDRVDYLEAHPDVDFLHTDILMIDENSHPLIKGGKSDWATEIYEELEVFKQAKPADFFTYRLTVQLVVQANSVMFRERVKWICATYKQLALVIDNEVWFRSQLRFKWDFLDKVTLHYRIHSNNTKKQYDQSNLDDEYARQMSRLYENLYDDCLTLPSTPDLEHKKKWILRAAHYWWVDANSTHQTLAHRAAFLSSHYRPLMWIKMLLRVAVKATFNTDLKRLTKK